MAGGGGQAENRRVEGGRRWLICLYFGHCVTRRRCRRVRSCWRRYREALQANLSKPTFETWIGRPRCSGFQLMDACFSRPPNSFACGWTAAKNYSDHDRGGGPPSLAGQHLRVRSRPSRGSRPRIWPRRRALAVALELWRQPPCMLLVGSAPASMHAGPSTAGGKTPRRPAPGTEPPPTVQTALRWGGTAAWPTPPRWRWAEAPGASSIPLFPLLVVVGPWVKPT